MRLLSTLGLLAGVFLFAPKGLWVVTVPAYLYPGTHFPKISRQPEEHVTLKLTYQRAPGHWRSATTPDGDIEYHFRQVLTQIWR
jgi:hypothetical protein